MSLLESENYPYISKPEEQTIDVLSLPGISVDPSNFKIIEGENFPEGYSVNVPTLPEWPFDGPVPDDIRTTFDIEANSFYQVYEVAGQNVGEVATTTYEKHKKAVLEVGRAIQEQETQAEVANDANKMALEKAIASLTAQLESLNNKVASTKEEGEAYQNKDAELSLNWRISVERAAFNIHRKKVEFETALRDHNERRTSAVRAIDSLRSERRSKEALLAAEEANLINQEGTLDSLESAKVKKTDALAKKEEEDNILRDRLALESIGMNNPEFKTLAETGGRDAILKKFHKIKQEISNDETSVITKSIREIKDNLVAIEGAIITHKNTRDAHRAEIIKLKARLAKIPALLALEHEKYRYEITEVRPKMEANSQIFLAVSEVFEPISKGEMELTSQSKFSKEWGLTAVSKSIEALINHRTHGMKSGVNNPERIADIKFDADEVPFIPLSDGSTFDYSALNSDPQESQQSPVENNASERHEKQKKNLGQRALGWLLGYSDEDKDNNSNQNEAKRLEITQ